MPKYRKSRGNRQGSTKRRLLQKGEEVIENGTLPRIDTSEDEHSVKKSDLINEALKTSHAGEDPFNDELSLLGLQDGGFTDNPIRAKCWRKLLTPEAVEKSRESLAPLNERVQRQIELDVARSYGDIIQGAAEKRNKLKFVLKDFFRRNPELHYYQGFHDIVMVIMDVFTEPAEQIMIAERISYNYVFRDALGPDFKLVESLLRTIQLLVKMVDPEVADIIASTPFWGVSMLLTCFAHDIPSKLARLRVFDALLAHYPGFHLYLVAALPLLPSVRRAIIAAEDESHAHEAVRTGACQIKTVREADILVRTARGLMDRVPLDQLLVQGEISCALTRESCLFHTFSLYFKWSPPPASRLETLPKTRTLQNLTGFVHTTVTILRKGMSMRYWAVAVFVAIIAATLTLRHRK